ncbi:site-specific integrase [uncultured Marixanthomonas sp.]|uniref:site-specific integrase n=1 Tax=uncultured Marixanthomonas sp. TaxID=757245 RepID=UPI0030D7EC06|tara:strand:- start:103 stop:1323 length:1221 start_codon:yes stop_codon:yes gene_type:complete
MRSTNTFSILFWADQKNATNNEALVYARITVNQKRANISLKRRVPIKFWDAKKNRSKGTGIATKQMNNYLDQTYTKLFQIYQDLTYKEELITAKIIKARFIGDDEKSKSLLDLIAYHSKKIENTLTKGTIKNFGVTENYLNKFLQKHKKTTDIYLKQMDYKFLIDFENYLANVWPIGHPRAMGQNTIMKHIQRLRKMVTLAYHMEWLERDPFARWKPQYEKTNREFLSETELENLESHDFNSDRLDRVRDLFVFSCYTGISYVDIMNLTADNVMKSIDCGNWITTKRKKTKSAVKVPLLRKAEEIIEKYSNHPMTAVTSSLLPIITNEKLNVYLKEVANHVGIKKNLTFHMARHTFATTITLSNGVPIETVSKLLGHTKIATTQIYARVLEKKVGEDMEKLKQKLG